MKNIAARLAVIFLTPIRACRRRYLPLLLVYFAYGASTMGNVAASFWEKESLTLTAEQLLSIGAWVAVPWTLKIVVGQFIDSKKIFGSRRRGYVFLGAILLAAGTVLLAELAGGGAWVTSFGSQYGAYLLANVLMITGFMVQDVAADTMSTEVVPRKGRTQADIRGDLAMVQVLGRIALGAGILSGALVSGWLAGTFEATTVFWLLLIVPVLSCVGAATVKLEKLESRPGHPLDRKILVTGLLFAAFTVGIGWWEPPFAQEIVFGVSLVLLSTLLWLVTRDVPRKKFNGIVAAMVALFLFRLTPSVGPGFTWWEMDVLGFDEHFFGRLAQIGAVVSLIILWTGANFLAKYPVRSVLLFLIFFGTLMSLPELGLYFNVHEMIGLDARTVALVDTAASNPLVHIGMVPLLTLIAVHAPEANRGTWFAIGASLMNLALSGGSIASKWLNKIFVVSREVLAESGEVLTAQNYKPLGPLLLIVVGIGVVIPLVGVLGFLRRGSRV